MIFDLPPKLWLPEKPAIIRPAEQHLLSPGYLPTNRQERRAALAELIQSGKLTKEQAANSLVVKLSPFAAMFTMNQLIGFGGSGRYPVDFNFLTSVIDLNNLTIYTYPNVTLGTAASDRIIIVGIHGRASASPNSVISNVTIGGITATQAGASRLLNLLIQEIWFAIVPTGTTGNIVVTFGEGQVASSIGVWNVFGANPVPFDTDGGTGTGATLSITNLTIPDNGCGVMSYNNTTTTTAVVWTNATSRFDNTNRHSGADSITPGTLTITADGATDDQAMAAVSFEPS
jgi:hypothetical protein